jgi:hypothetical protein
MDRGREGDKKKQQRKREGRNRESGEKVAIISFA